MLQAEFDAEQEALKTMSYLTVEKQEEYRQRQSVSFMYTKPPGLEAALAKEKEQQAKEEKQKAHALVSTVQTPSPFPGEEPWHLAC